MSVNTISLNDFQRLLKAGRQLNILDVRTPAEFAQSARGRADAFRWTDWTLPPSRRLGRVRTRRCYYPTPVPHCQSV